MSNEISSARREITAKANNRTKFEKVLNSIYRSKYLLIMFLPGFALVILFKYVPMTGLLMAFQDFSLRKGLFASDWVGLQHFKALFTGPDFISALKNTLSISMLKYIFGFPAPILLALMFNEIRCQSYKKITQTISYLPHFLSWVVMSGLITMSLSPSVGIVNKIIGLFGVEPIYFMAEPKWFVPILIITDIWKEVGWGSIVYLAALAGINAEYHEAATIDGANRFQRIIYINIPSILSTVSVMLILKMGGLLDAGFDQILNLQTPATQNVSDILDTYIYRFGFKSYKYSFSTAAGMFKSVVGLIMIVLTNAIANKLSDGEDGLW